MLVSGAKSLLGACSHARAALLALVLAGRLAGGATAGAAVPAPTVSTGGISSLTYSSVVLHGRVSPHGQTTSYLFEYGHTRKYGAQTPLAAAGSTTSSVPVTQTVTGLQPLTVYHYRIVAVNAGGTVPGADRSFTTPKV